MDWKPVKDFPGYYVNRQGQVQGIRNNNLIKGYFRKDGRYVALRRDRKNYYRKVDELIREAFSQ